VQGRGHSLTWHIIPKFPRRDQGKARKASISVAVLQAKIWTRDLPNKNHSTATFRTDSLHWQLTSRVWLVLLCYCWQFLHPPDLYALWKLLPRFSFGIEYLLKQRPLSQLFHSLLSGTVRSVEQHSPVLLTTQKTLMKSFVLGVSLTAKCFPHPITSIIWYV
jgi:hypothetical protein